MNEAILLPGQGAQYPGMGRDWCDAFASASMLFQRADDTLGFSLSDACWNRGDEVHRTDIAQPGIFTTSAAILTVAREQGLDTSTAPIVAGLSLGEYTALWVAGSLSFEDGVRLVRLRGEAMQDASEQLPSGMSSLIGATEAQAQALAKVGAAHGICSVANLNAPGQVVVSGEIAALEAVEAAAKEHGVKRARRLVVAGGFHSECMRPAAERLSAALADVAIAAPQVPLITNVTGATVSDPEEIRRNLAEQLCSPVLWEKSMRRALEMGVEAFLEPGPGQILSGLLRKLDRVMPCRSLAVPDDLVPGHAGAEDA